MKKFLILMIVVIFAIWQIGQMLMDKSYLEIEYANINKNVSQIDEEISSYKLKYKNVINYSSDLKELQKYKKLIEDEDKNITNYNSILEKENQKINYENNKNTNYHLNIPSYMVLGGKYSSMQINETITKYVNLINESIEKRTNYVNTFNPILNRYNLYKESISEKNDLQLKIDSNNKEINTYNNYYNIHFRLYYYIGISFVNKINNISF